MDKTRLKETMESFYLATHVPIIAFPINEKKILSHGYTEALHNYFHDYNVKDKIFSHLLKDVNLNMVTIMSSKDVFFTACSVCPKNNCKGVFVFGPYSLNKNNGQDIIYKPKNIIPHYTYLLHTLWKEHNSKKNKDLGNIPYSLHVKKAIDYINNNYQEDLKLCHVSTYLNVSKCYFCSLFKGETGKTFTQFLNEVRVEKSKELLIKKDLSMLHIALSVGFNTQNYYNITFKKITNKTPSQYRNSLLS